MIYYADIKENLIDGYYCKEIHEIIPENAIPLSEELWQHLLDENKRVVDVDKLSMVVFTLDEEHCYTIEHKDFFSIEEPIMTYDLRTQEQKEIEELKDKINKLEKLINDKL